MQAYILGYLATGLYGLFTLIHGYKEQREKQYRGFFRTNIFREAIPFAINGNRVVPVAIWHIVAGILLVATSLYSLAQNDSNVVSFIIKWIFVYGIIEIIIGTISFGPLTRQHRQIALEQESTTETESKPC